MNNHKEIDDEKGSVRNLPSENKRIENEAGQAAKSVADNFDENEYAPDPDFDLDKELAKRAENHNDFGYDTGALDLDTLSEADREILSQTRPIHIDRDDIPYETQAIHILTLERKKRSFHKKIYFLIVLLLMAGTAVALIGLHFNKKSTEESGQPEATVTPEETEVPDETDSLRTVIISEKEFPDAEFREYISSHVDKNGDGEVTPDERNTLIVLNLSGDENLTDMKGINLFPNLQAVNISNTMVDTIDLSANTILKSLDVSNTKILTLDLSHNHELKDINVSNTGIYSIVFADDAEVSAITKDETELVCEINLNGYLTACTGPEPEPEETPDEDGETEEEDTDNSGD